jgi:hypothetical protein
MLKENRAAARSDIVLVARVRRSIGISSPIDGVDGLEYGVAMHDASRDGLSFLTDQAFRIGTVLEIRVLCDGRELQLFGAVKYVRSFRETTGIYIAGVKFIRLPASRQDVVDFEQWLDRHSTASTDFDEPGH